MNPYTRLFYRALARRGFELVPEGRLTVAWLCGARHRVSVLHFHWCPNELYECRNVPPRVRVACSWALLPLFALRLVAARALGYSLMWTIHEVYPHASLSRRLDRVAGRMLARASQVRLAHDRPTAGRARRELGAPALEVAVVPHGSYAGFYPDGRPREEVRRELGIARDAFAFLCFGTVKPYKEIDLLLEAFRSLPHLRAALVVAGRARDPSVAEAVRSAAARDPRIRPSLSHVPDERVGELYAACDAAVLPRSDGWTSGSLILALSQGLPVVAARAPAYEELVADAGWLFHPGDVTSLRAALAGAAGDPAAARTLASRARARAERLSWDECASTTASLLESAARERRADTLVPQGAPVERR